MNDILRELAAPILLNLLLPGIMGFASWLLYRVYAWWKRLTGYEVDEQTRLRLNAAFENAIRFGLNAALMRKGYSSLSLLSADDKRAALDDAVDYVQQFNPGDLQRFGLTRPKLKDRLTPLLPIDRSNLG